MTGGKNTYLTQEQRAELNRMALSFAEALKKNHLADFNSALFARAFCANFNNPQRDSVDPKRIRIDISAPLRKDMLLAQNFELVMEPDQVAGLFMESARLQLDLYARKAFIELGLMGETEAHELRRQIDKLCPVGAVITDELKAAIFKAVDEINTSWQFHNRIFSK